MVEETADALIRAVDEAVARLEHLDEAAVTARSDPGVWSIKEILGHLVDSAANNHQRFVRAQDGEVLAFPKYEQDAWVRTQDYQSRSWPDLITFWRIYNQHLAHVIRRIPAAKLGMECRIEPYEPVTLGYLVEDYLAHLRHHLTQIDRRRVAA